MAYGNNNRDSGRDSGRDYQPREMYPAVCSKCGKKCEVPFKPIDGKPIFCRDCYSKKKDSNRSYNNNYN